MIRIRVKNRKLLRKMGIAIVGLWACAGWLAIVPLDAHSSHPKRSTLITAEPLGLILWAGPIVAFLLGWLLYELFTIEFHNPYRR